MLCIQVYKVESGMGFGECSGADGRCDDGMGMVGARRELHSTGNTRPRRELSHEPLSNTISQFFQSSSLIMGQSF